jgi:hypothetical protein
MLMLKQVAQNIPMWVVGQLVVVFGVGKSWMGDWTLVAWMKGHIVGLCLLQPDEHVSMDHRKRGCFARHVLEMHTQGSRGVETCQVWTFGLWVDFWTM